MGLVILEGRFQGTPEGRPVVQLWTPADLLAVMMEWRVHTRMCVHVCGCWG